MCEEFIGGSQSYFCRKEIKQENSQDVLAYVKIPHRANVVLLVIATEQWKI